MALLAAQSPTATGLTPTYSLVSASDTVRYVNNRMFLLCKNTSGSANTVTVVVPGSTYGQANPDIAVTVPATTGEKWIGPLDRGMVDTSTGLITITNSAPATGVSVAVVAL
jgi:hypothetical protein